MGPFLLAAPNPTMATFQLQMAPAPTAASLAASSEAMTLALEHQQQQLSPNSATSSGGESCSTPGHTTPGGTTTVLTQDGQQMMLQTSANVSPQLVQLAQPSQQLYMPMQAAMQQPRVVAMRTAQGLQIDEMHERTSMI